MGNDIPGIKNPVFSNADGTAIDVIMTHDIYGDIPFTATQYDKEERGRVIYAAAINGEYGEIAPYEPSATDAYSILVKNTARRDQLLQEATTEAYPLQLRVSMGTATDEQKTRLEALNTYILELDDMTPAQLQQSPASFPAVTATIF